MNVNVTEGMMSKDNELGAEFIPPTQMTSIIDDTEIQIKHEEMEFHSNSTSHFDPEDNLDIETNIQHVDCNSGQAVLKDMNDIYLDLLQCERNCETCQKYLRKLREHVRSIHAPPQSIKDPLLIDPLHINIDPDPPQAEQSSSVQIKCEVDEVIEEMEYSAQDSESKCESDPDFELESGNENESDPDYSESTTLTQNVRHQGHPAKNYSSSESSTSKAATGILSSQKQLKCSECSKSFERRFDLKNHMTVHTGERPYKCNVCEKGFSTSCHLKEHERIHTGEKPYACGECEHSFSTKTGLTRHKRNHSGQKPYKCTVCEKGFTTIGAFNIHNRIHTGEKPFQCDECEKCFARSDHLTLHKRSHTGERPFECTVCEKSFTQSGVLAKHMRCHTGEKSYVCDVCEKSFKYLSSLTRHTKIHTGECSV